ncbi:MAG: beta/gamma crystallin domain-containing protein [Gammaproteobacteria bacterium]
MLFACADVLATTHEDKDKGAAATKSDATTPQDRSASESKTEESAVTVGVPVTVMVPMEFKVEPQAKRCWVELYSKDGFRGDRLTLVGPLDMAKMRGPFGADWQNEVESIRTGPKATVTIFDNENFVEHSEVVVPHKQIADLDNRMELFDNFRAMRVEC